MKKIIAIFLAVVLFVGMAVPMTANAFLFGDKNQPKLRLIVPENWEMEIGDSRTVDYVFDGTENRVLDWSVSPEEIASRQVMRLLPLRTAKVLQTALRSGLFLHQQRQKKHSARLTTASVLLRNQIFCRRLSQDTLLMMQMYPQRLRMQTTMRMLRLQKQRTA